VAVRPPVKRLTVYSLTTYSSSIPEPSLRFNGPRRLPWCGSTAHMDLIFAAFLLIFLLVSTLGWAVVYSRRPDHVDGSGKDLAYARLWASAIPLAVVLVLIAASFTAFFASDDAGGVERIRSAVGAVPVRIALVICGVATMVPFAACVKAWRDSRWTLPVRVHMSVYLVALIALLGLLLLAGG